jgi:hypothetical protein
MTVTRGLAVPDRLTECPESDGLPMPELPGEHRRGRARAACRRGDADDILGMIRLRARTILKVGIVGCRRSDGEHGPEQ